MTEQAYGKRYGGNAAENYQRYFVPAIGRPVAEGLIDVARLQAGERVLDVACGTGVVTRLAAERVGAGLAAGLDINPAMLAVARAETPSDAAIDWYEASADSMPLQDQTFDVVLCQMGLQFFPDKATALREMRRVLKTGGRVYVNLPGPKPELFQIMGDALARHLGPQAAAFVDLVFSMHDVDALTELMAGAGFLEVEVQAKPTDLHLPAPEDFLWQYVYSTPMAEATAKVDPGTLDALERDVCSQWRELAAADGTLSGQVGMTTGSAVK